MNTEDGTLRAALKRLLEAYDSDASEFEAAAAAQQARHALAAPEGAAPKSDITDCGHSKYDPCHNCEPIRCDGNHAQVVPCTDPNCWQGEDATRPEGWQHNVSSIALIAAERQRQISEEGWTAEHDDVHIRGEIADAAACYAATTRVFKSEQFAGRAYAPYTAYSDLWPWEGIWWKPKDRIRDLVRAGALIAAEIDRLQRTGELQRK